MAKGAFVSGENGGAFDEGERKFQGMPLEAVGGNQVKKVSPLFEQKFG